MRTQRACCKGQLTSSLHGSTKSKPDYVSAAASWATPICKSSTPSGMKSKPSGDEATDVPCAPGRALQHVGTARLESKRVCLSGRGAPCHYEHASAFTIVPTCG